jgi:hypothetical protein
MSKINDPKNRTPPRMAGPHNCSAYWMTPMRDCLMITSIIVGKASYTRNLCGLEV